MSLDKCCFCESEIKNNRCLKCKAKFLEVDLNCEDNFDVILYNIEFIAGKLKIDREILENYLENKREITNFLDGIKIIEDDENEENIIAISSKLKIKEDIIEKDLFFNILNYCVFNKLYKIERKEFNEIEIYYEDENLLKEPFFIKNNSEESIILFDYNIERVMPEGYDHNLLNENEEDDIFNEACEFFQCLDNDIGSYYENIYINLKLTKNLENNMDLIKDFIEKNYKIYLNRIETFKNNNKKYFPKKILKEKIEKF